MTMKLYIPPQGTVVKKTMVSLNGPGIMIPVQLMQYDQQIPVLAVQVTCDGKPYIVPEHGSADLRMEKPDGKYVLNPALGVDEQRTTVFFSITRQMTAACGSAAAAMEIRSGQGILGVGYIPLHVQRNPVPVDAIISQDEVPAVEKLLQDTEAAAARANQAASTVEEKLASGALQGKPGPRGEPGPAGKDGTVSFEKLTDSQRASLKGEKGNPGKDAAPPLVYQDLQVEISDWNQYSPGCVEETRLRAAGYLYQARIPLKGADSSMIPYVTLGVDAAKISPLAQCCTEELYLYAKETCITRILTIECRKGVM